MFHVKDIAQNLKKTKIGLTKKELEDHKTSLYKLLTHPKSPQN